MNKFNIEPDELYYSMKHFQEVGCGVQYFEDPEYDGRTITVKNKKLLHFANCSYLGLEKYPDLVNGAIQATLKYGTQTSMSRGFLSSPLFLELESFLSQIFTGFPIVYASTTVAHYSVLPILAKEGDAIILDAFAHNSIRMASQLCKANGVFVLVSRHNDMDHVKYLIKRLKKEGYKNIWYCADGIYSMHGNVCDVKGLHTLLDQEENFYAYVDDAHGTGWCGKNGSGFVIGNFGLHPKMIVIESLSKSIGVTGGAVVVPDKKLSDYLKITGHTFIFATPLTPSTIGALIASLKLHLSDQISNFQKELLELIYYFRRKSKELDLPVVTKDITPIQLLRIGSTEKLLQVQRKLIDKGFFPSTAAYPAINKGDGGIRVSITRHITKLDIDNFLENVRNILEAVDINVAAQGLINI
jgi:7-keto-8-aminopelargonate synthetase and related enzymes